MGSIALKFEVPDSNLRALKKRLASLEITSPVMIEAVEKFADNKLLPALRSAAPRQSIGAKTIRGKVRGGKTGVDIKIGIVVRHKAARSFEFGRQYWYHGYKRAKGRGAILKQNPSKRRGPNGFRAEPWVGIKGGGVLEQMRPQFAQVIQETAKKVWENVGKT